MNPRQLTNHLTNLTQRTVKEYINDYPKERALIVGQELFTGWRDKKPNSEIFSEMIDKMCLRSISLKSKPIALAVANALRTGE